MAAVILTGRIGGGNEAVTGAAMTIVTATLATTMTGGEREDPPTTQGLGQDLGRYPSREAAGRGPGVTPPQERQRRYRGPG